MSKDWTPIHADKELNDQWWTDKGFVFGTNVWYNSIRDGSGRFNGYAIGFLDRGCEQVVVKTVAEAQIALMWLKGMEALKTIREAGYNTTDWATWAQKWAAHGMQPDRWPAPPKDAPEDK